MRFFITSDSNSETGVSEVQGDPALQMLMDFFKPLSYGTGLVGICVVLMCRAPYLDFKRRIRHSKKDKKVYMDIMLDYMIMKNSSHEKRKKIILERLLAEVPEVLLTKNIQDFNREKFITDLKNRAADIN